MGSEMCIRDSAWPDRLEVRIEEHQSGLFFATSPDLAGLLVAEPDLEGLWREIPKSIKLLFRAQGVEMQVLPSRPTDYERAAPWVAIPVDAAA